MNCPHLTPREQCPPKATYRSKAVVTGPGLAHLLTAPPQGLPSAFSCLSRSLLECVVTAPRPPALLTHLSVTGLWIRWAIPDPGTFCVVLVLLSKHLLTAYCMAGLQRCWNVVVSSICLWSLGGSQLGRKNRVLDSMMGDSWDRSNHRKTLWTGAWEIGVKSGVPFPAVVFE